MTDNNHCYRFNHLKYPSGFFDHFIAATYIITMGSPERMANIKKQLSFIIPTKNVFIVVNKGFRKCTKNLKRQETAYDLSDANLNIISHAYNNFGSNNILVLEDDYEFDERILDPVILSNVEWFLESYKSKPIYFNLGPTAILFYPNFNPFNPIFKTIYAGCSHAIIYNPSIIQSIYRDRLNKEIGHWDIYLNLNYDSYFYYKPLGYQTFPITENNKNWCSDFKENPTKYKLCQNYFLKLVRNFNEKTGLNKKPQPGFDILYTITILVNYLLLLLILYIIYVLFKYVNKLNKSIK